MLASDATRELMRKRNQMMSDFVAWREKLLNRYRADKPKRDALRGFDTNKQEVDMDTEELEFLVSTSREPYRPKG
ncbi:unnamed protein product [Dibothriocephalus latus]|uniref:Uncharacterized protein n=1 Tax=Dibothriocephalus latus TaxID=60516 RepID=A0A3P7LWZ1_DIBLA|nr:unnamed protein product [Dibothriocephalus latus]